MSCTLSPSKLSTHEPSAHSASQNGLHLAPVERPIRSLVAQAPLAHAPVFPAEPYAALSPRAPPGVPYFVAQFTYRHETVHASRPDVRRCPIANAAHQTDVLVRSASAAIVMDIAYGHKIAPEGDVFVTLADETVSGERLPPPPSGHF